MLFQCSKIDIQKTNFANVVEFISNFCQMITIYLYIFLLWDFINGDCCTYCFENPMKHIEQSESKNRYNSHETN